MMAVILNSNILDSAILVFHLKLTPSCEDWFPPFAQKKPSLIHSDSTWWWQPSWILPCWIQTLPSWIQTPSYLLLDSLKNTLPPLWLWLKLIQSDLLIDGSHLEFCHLEFGNLGFSHLSFSCQTHSHLPGLVPTICTKKPSLIHSDSTWWWQPSWILPCWIQTLPSWIQTPSYLLSDSLKNTLTPHWIWFKLIQSDSNLFILTKLDDGSHLEFHHFGFSHLSFSSQTHSHLPRLVPTICRKKTITHSFWLNLMMAAILNSTMLDSDTAILDSDTFLSSLRFTQKHSSFLWLWLKLIQSD